MPALCAARRAITWQTVTEMSASFLLRVIAPAAFLVLRIDDQLDGQAELVAEVRALGHAVALGQEERGEAVAVHRSLGRRRRLDDEAAGLGVGQQVVDGPLDAARPYGPRPGVLPPDMKAMPHRPQIAALLRWVPRPKLPSPFCRLASHCSPWSMARCAAGLIISAAVFSGSAVCAAAGEAKSRRRKIAPKAPL